MKLKFMIDRCVPRRPSRAAEEATSACPTSVDVGVATDEAAAVREIERIVAAHETGAIAQQKASIAQLVEWFNQMNQEVGKMSQDMGTLGQDIDDGLANRSATAFKTNADLQLQHGSRRYETKKAREQRRSPRKAAQNISGTKG